MSKNNVNNCIIDESTSMTVDTKIRYPRQFDTFMQDAFADKNDDPLNYNTTKQFFEPWTIMNTVWNDVKKWQPPYKYTHLYIFSNEYNESTNNDHTIKSSQNIVKHKRLHIGISNDIKHRLDQLNGVVSGGSTQAKKNSGKWKITFIARFPPLMNYNLKELRNQFKNIIGEKIAYRYLRVLHIVEILSLEYFISHLLLDNTSDFYQEIVHKHIENLKTHGKFTDDKNLLPKEIVDIV
jgi:hypothetical protein